MDPMDYWRKQREDPGKGSILIGEWYIGFCILFFVGLVVCALVDVF